MTITPGAGPRSPMFLPELDVMRGAAILWVMYLHVYFSGWASSPEWEGWFLRVTHLLAHGAVPVFLFISGVLVTRATARGFLSFASKRARRVLVPGLTWLTLALAWEAWRAGGLSRDLIEAYLLFDISGQFYYLVVLVTLTVAAYGWLRAPASILTRVAVVAVVVSAVTTAWYEQQTLSGTFAIVAYRNPLVWCGFFAMGMAASRRWPGLRWPRTVTLVASLVMVLAAAVYLYGYGAQGYTPQSYFGVTVFTFSAASLFVWPAVARRALTSELPAVARAARGAAWLAPYAFALYLVHKPYFVGWLSDRVVSDTVLAEDYVRLMLGLFVVGAGASLAFVVALGRVWPWGARVLVGVERPSPGIRAQREDALRAAGGAMPDGK
ncbi:MAG: hypothetical protein AMXMBFR23_05110 [Chloroflexota bacterium]